jgi:hypothetical protein
MKREAATPTLRYNPSTNKDKQFPSVRKSSAHLVEVLTRVWWPQNSWIPGWNTDYVCCKGSRTLSPAGLIYVSVLLRTSWWGDGFTSQTERARWGRRLLRDGSFLPAPTSRHHEARSRPGQGGGGVGGGVAGGEGPLFAPEISPGTSPPERVLFGPKWGFSGFWVKKGPFLGGGYLIKG